MTAHWQRPRDEHGRFVAGTMNSTAPTIGAGNGEPRSTFAADCWREIGFDSAAHYLAACRYSWDDGLGYHVCIRKLGHDGDHRVNVAALGRSPISWPDPPRAECSWWTDLEPAHRTTLLAALPFVIALLGLGFSIAALIVGVQR